MTVITTTEAGKRTAEEAEVDFRQFTERCLACDSGAAASAASVVRAYRNFTEDQLAAGRTVLEGIQEYWRHVRLKAIDGEQWVFGIRITDYGPAWELEQAHQTSDLVREFDYEMAERRRSHAERAARGEEEDDLPW